VLIASAHLVRPKPGETVCGDAALVRDLGPSRTLFALIDALGHGPAAAEAASIAVAALQACRPSASAPEIVQGLHEALRGSRGIAALVGVLDGDTVRACIVGNVELRASRDGAVGVIHSPGILGIAVRKKHIFEGRVRPGDRLVAFSDGLSTSLYASALDGLDAGAACELALERFGLSSDDASVLVLDVLRGGGAP
jgi:phosphoserine phosphatase RsbX